MKLGIPQLLLMLFLGDDDEPLDLRKIQDIVAQRLNGLVQKNLDTQMKSFHGLFLIGILLFQNHLLDWELANVTKDCFVFKVVKQAMCLVFTEMLVSMHFTTSLFAFCLLVINHLIVIIHITKFTSLKATLDANVSLITLSFSSLNLILKSFCNILSMSNDFIDPVKIIYIDEIILSALRWSTIWMLVSFTCRLLLPHTIVFIS